MREFSSGGLAGVSADANTRESIYDAIARRETFATNGGSTRTTLVLVDSGDPDGTFFTGSASPAAASNHANLRLQFRSTGGQPNHTCLGDEVRVRGIPSVGSAGSFIVRKDFSDDNASSVSVSLACSSGTVTNSPRNASEAFPAIFYIQGQSSGATCSASENGVPSGYTSNEAGCQDGDPANGACTIIKTLNTTPQEVDILYSTFEDGQFGGWSTGANVAVDSTLAIGQYALHLEDDGAISTRAISTAGYTGVSVTVGMAATGLGGADGTFATATTSTASASNNPNFRLRFQMSGKGKGEHCHGDEIRVRGTP